MWAALALIGGLGTAALGDMVSEEVRDRLDQLPHAILRLAARRLEPEQRIRFYEEVWLPDLAFVLRGDDARPVTRLILGTRFAVGILVSAGWTGAALRENGRLIAAVEYGSAGPEGLARKFIDRADPERPGRWKRSAGGLLIVSVDRLSPARAADLAVCMSSSGRPDVAVWWAACWLRPERTCARRPDDAVAMYWRLRGSWGGDLAELRVAFLRAIDHWSGVSREKVEQGLDEDAGVARRLLD